MNSKKIVLLLSGEKASGKTTICNGLRDHFEFHLISTREALKSLAQREHKGQAPDDTAFLQKFGTKLDKKTKGTWVIKEIQSEIAKHDRVLIDSVRVEEQIDSFRNAFGNAVVHIHLDAPADWRKEQFRLRIKKGDYKTPAEADAKFDEYSADPTEKKVKFLKDKADLVIYTKDSSGPRDQVTRAASFLRLLPPINKRNVDVIVGGQFGSEGKGQVAAHIAPEYDCLVRVGGPNAGHKVFATPEPHVFRILPSGTTKALKAKIVIGPGAVISEEVLLDEIARFNLDPTRLLIDEQATIIRPEDIKLEEEWGNIGSTKQGVGAATANNILLRLKANDSAKARNSTKLRPYIDKAHEYFEKLHAGDRKILLEGTQGTLLSLHHGYYPYVTSRDTSVSGCLAECGFGPLKVRKVIMVTRRYPIRVADPEGGTSGEFHSPMITREEIFNRSGFPLKEMEKLEKSSVSKKDRRLAEFSWNLFRLACEFNTPTDIALTFADYISYSNQQARRYDQLTPITTKFIDEMERCAGVPVSLISTRFHHRAIIDRRNWI